MAFQQNPIPQGQPGPYGTSQMPGGGTHPPNPAIRHLPPGNSQWKSGPSNMSEPPQGVNGFSGANGMDQNSQRPPLSGQNFMNGPTNAHSSMNFRPGIPPGPEQNRMQGPPTQFGGPRPPISSPGTPISSPGQRMPGLPPRLGTPVMPMAPHGPTGIQQQRPSQVPSELPVPFHGQGQYTHQIGTSLAAGITPANSGPPSERTSRDNSPALPSSTESSQYDALEGQWKPTVQNMARTSGQTGQQMVSPASQGGQQSMAPTVLTNSQVPGFTPMTSMGQVPGLPPSSQSMAPGSIRQPGPGFTSPQTSTGARPGFPPTSVPGQRPGFPAQPPVVNQHSGIRPPSFQPTQPAPPSTSAGQQVGFPPPSSLPNPQLGFPPQNSNAVNHQPGFAPPHSSLANQQPGFNPPPSNLANQQPGFPPQPVSTNQHPGFPPAPGINAQRPGFPPQATTLANQHAGFPPQPVSTNQHPGFPPISSVQQPARQQLPPSTNFQPFPNNQPHRAMGPPGPHGEGQQKGTSIEEFVNRYPKPKPGMNSLQTNFGNMTVQGPKVWNLVQEKRLISPEGVETPKPVIPNDFKNVNCSPDVFRCTLNAIPQTSALLNKARLPLGILIHPFKDLSQLPVIQSSVIVRCRSCRTYINPFVYFLDSRRWKCNLCYRANELPDEFSFDPVSKTYGDPQRRPEIKSATIEFIAPSEYMLRPPQPAVYLYLLDVTFNAVETGYLKNYCKTLLDLLDKIPGDSRTLIGFIAYDSAVHFFNLAEGLSQPQMLTVTDVDDIFLPCPDDLLVNLNESRNLVEDLLKQLPSMFEGNTETRSALGAALQAAYKMISGPGGRVTVMQTILPSIGPGALQNREDTTHNTGKDVPNLGPATDFYKKLALDCSAQQVAVDLFMFSGQYADISSIECISKFSGGVVQYYPSYHSIRTPHLVKKFELDLRRYLTRKIGFEAVMRIRCSKGLSIHTFHGNFFVRSTDLLSLPNINPDAGFGMQMSIEEPLTDMSTMCFQAALLYTSSKGERRIRVHTLCLPITNQISEIYAAADQQAIIALLAKMAVDRSLTSSMSDAREAIVNATLDVLNSYGSTLPSTKRAGSICINDELRLMPLYCLALLKSTGFRVGVPVKLDERVFALQECKTQPCGQLLMKLHPNLYPLHTIMDVEMAKKGNMDYPKLPVLQLSSANVDRNGAYLLDTGNTVYLYIGSSISEQFCKDIFDKPNFAAIEEGGVAEFPDLENEGSERFHDFITYLMDSRPDGAAFIVVREDGRLRMQFFQYFVEDRTESSMSYYEYLQHIQKQLKS